MNTVGVICEFNPFHNGHKYLLDQLRGRGADLLICAMSGSFVQRGESAVADKFTRAACAVASGADLVVELPFPYCMASAEFFASAGVYVLDKLGADTLGFGSESADEEMLTAAAQVVGTEDFVREYRRLCRGGKGSAAAYFEAYRNVSGEDMKCAPNDILALAYIKAIQSSGIGMDTEIIQRRGSAYDSQHITAGELPSATALRQALWSQGLDGWRGHVPEETFDFLAHAAEQGMLGSQIDNVWHDVITFLRLSDVGGFADIAEAGGGLAQRICSAAAGVNGYEGFVSRVSSANYTAARVRRAILNMLTGVTSEDLNRRPAYVQLLAANARGREYLSSRRREEGLPIVTKPADARDVVGGTRQYELSRRAEALWCMTLPQILPADTLTKMKPFFLDPLLR